MKKHRKFGGVAFLSAIPVLFCMQGCVDHKLPAPEGIECSQTVSFAREVSPIINSRCAIVGDGGCHNSGNGPDVDFREFSKIQSHAAHVKDRILRTPGSVGYMPKIGSLTDAQIQVISCWVDQGAPDN